jgi:hypothetical protein
MKRWQKLFPAMLLGCGLLVSSVFPLLAHSQEAGTNRKAIYLFSTEFPPSLLTQYPTPPIQETKFWQILDKNISETQDLSLTQNLEDADYQVELRCSGILNCTRLVVDVKDSKRMLLTSFNVTNYSTYFGFGRPDLNLVSQRLTQKLDEHLKLLGQGGYGHTE